MADAANDDLASGDGLQLGANPQQPPPASTSVTPAKPMAGQGEIGVGAIKAAATQNVDEPHAGNADLLPFPGDSLELQGEPGEIGRPGAAARTAALQGTPAQQIARASVQGVERLSVQLHPADLGSVEIHVDVARDGQVSAHITAESAETLELLQRDVRMLERGLGESGVRLESGGLSFSLRQEQQPGQGFNPGADQRGGQPGGRSPAPAAETAADAQPARRLSQHLLDISA
jgi:flagellar hook-length control protein FliK